MNLYKSFKMSIGFALAILIANLLNLDFSVSAGIITMINIVDTKKESARIAWKRIYTSAIGLLLVALIFNTLNFGIYNLVVFLIIFIPIAFKLNAKEGIIVNVVLATHLIELDNIVFAHLYNEFALVVLGAGIALIMNLHMPNKKNLILEAIDDVEEKIKNILVSLSCNIKDMCIISEDDLSLVLLEKEVKSAKKISFEYMNNHWLQDNRYFLEYFNMRLQQVYRLKYMSERLNQVLIDNDIAITLSEFTIRLAIELDELNDGINLLKDVKMLKKNFENLELPNTHNEFIERSAFLQYINDLEEFILIKIRFFEKQLLI